jgi:hypothetical protein
LADPGGESRLSVDQVSTASRVLFEIRFGLAVSGQLVVGVGVKTTLTVAVPLPRITNVVGWPGASAKLAASVPPTARPVTVTGVAVVLVKVKDRGSAGARFSALENTSRGTDRPSSVLSAEVTLTCGVPVCASVQLTDAGVLTFPALSATVAEIVWAPSV